MKRSRSFHQKTDSDPLKFHQSDSNEIKIEPEEIPCTPVKRNRVLDQLDRDIRELRESHKQKGQNFKYFCSICDDKFLFESTLKRHVKNHEQIEISSGVKCTFCPTKFDCKEELLRHKLEMHKNKLTLLKCKNCDEKFGSVEELNAHTMTHYHRSSKSAAKPAEENIQEDQTAEEPEIMQKESWNCEKCLDKFDSVFNLHSHEIKRHKGQIVCLLCNKAYSTKSALFVHLRRHLNIKKFECEICKKTFCESNELSRHRFTHIDPQNRPFKCSNCPKSYTSSTELKVHQTSKHLGKQFQCDLCPRKYSRMDLLKKHVKDCHMEPPQGNLVVQKSCPECEKTFTNLKAYNIHLKTHNSPLFTCQKCGWYTHSESHLKIHQKEKHEDFENRETVCDICNKAYANVKCLKDHIKRVHQEIGEFICDFCHKKFSTKFSMEMHLKIHNRETKREEFRCIKCVLIFNDEFEYQQHQNSHIELNKSQKYERKSGHGDKPVSCSVCQKWFRGKWWLEVHERSHTNERPFKCTHENCKQAFFTNFALKNHLRVHSKEKAHQCTVCGKSFAEKKTLRLHSYLHTGERPYNCTICGRGFITRHFLKTHTFKHLKAGETVENFPVDERERIKRLQQIKQVQTQLKYGTLSDNLQINIDFSGLEMEENVENKTGDAGTNQDIFVVQNIEGNASGQIFALSAHQNSDGKSNKILAEENLIDDIIEYDETGQLSEKDEEIPSKSNENQEDDVETNILDTTRLSDILQINQVIPINDSEFLENCIFEEIQSDSTTMIGQIQGNNLVVYEQAEQESEGDLIDFQVETIDVPIIHQTRIVYSQNLCPYCKVTYKDSDELEKHIDLVHVPERPHFCLICGFRFKEKSKLERHFKIHLNDRQFECQTCGRKFLEKFSLTKHEKLHLGEEKPLKCLCGSGFRNETALNIHKYTCHILKVQGLEIKDFKSVDEVLEIGQKIQNPDFTLENCKIGEDDYKCGYCRKSFYRIESLEHHLKVHKQQDQISVLSCSECDFTSKNKGSLYSHIKQVHPSSEMNQTEILSKEQRNELVPCQICSKTMARCRIDRHIKTVHSQVFYRCPRENCQKLFNNMTKLIGHVKTQCNSQEKLIQEPTRKSSKEVRCEICNITVSSISNLKRHQARHFNDRQYSCDFCSEKFFTKQTKISHVVKVHQGSGQTSD